MVNMTFEDFHLVICVVILIKLWLLGLYLGSRHS